MRLKIVILLSVLTATTGLHAQVVRHEVRAGDVRKYWIDSVLTMIPVYEWKIDGQLQQSGPQALFTVRWEVPGTYLLTANVFYPGGCSAMEQMLEVYVSEGLPGEHRMIMPTVFTPDNNNLNDLFRPVIVGDDLPEIFRMMIYDKWGRMIFETKDYTKGWDGSYGRGHAPGGVYVYVIEYVWTSAGESGQPVRGTVTLIR